MELEARRRATARLIGQGVSGRTLTSLTDFCRKKMLFNCFLGHALSLTVAKPYKIWEVQSRGLGGAHTVVRIS